MTYSTPFAVLRRSFGLLASGPGQPVLDVAGVDGAPGPLLSAGELDRWLLRAPRETADEVWRHLIVCARSQDPTWTVVAAGLALPGLYGVRAKLGRGLGDELADLEGELLAALVAEIRAVDLGPAAVCGRLVYAARKAGQRYRYTVDRSRRREARWSFAADASMVPVRGPVTVLAEAMRAGVVDALEADLLARTYLEGQTLASVAAELGLSYITARRYRQRARSRLANVLDAKEPASPVSAIGA